MLTYNLVLVRGDDKYYKLTFTDSNGDAINITDWDIYFTAKNDMDDPDESAILQYHVTPTGEDAIAGLASIHIKSTDTSELCGNYYYDIEVRKDTNNVFTVLAGILTFKQDITFG